MRAQLAYFGYVLQHKWFVFLGCLKCRVPLHQALIHDWSKFVPVEWGPYVQNFYNPDGSRRQIRDETGAYNPADQPSEFQRAWLHHQRLRHHWQAWVMLGNAGSYCALPMPERFIREMIADWYGAGRAIAGVQDPGLWYAANQFKMNLHPETRRRIAQLLVELFP